MECQLTIEINETSRIETVWKDVEKLCKPLSASLRRCLKDDIAEKISVTIGGRNLTPQHLRKAKEKIETLKRKINIRYDNSVTPSNVLIETLKKLPIIKKIKDSTLTSTGSNFLSLDTEPSLNPNLLEQSSLFLSPLGSNHLYGWNIKGGNGVGVNCFIIDVEFTPNEDIPTELYNDNYQEGPHGSYMATIIGARNNTQGYIGIVPESPLYYEDESDNFEQVFIYGKAGDVVNISLGSSAGGVDGPIVGDENYRDYIYLAYLMGITTCYAAGNGGINLDEVYVEGEGYIYNKTSEDFINPYGICVSGGSCMYSSWIRKYNYGNIVDVFSDCFFEHLTGTSFSCPRITGLVAQLQSIYYHANQEYLDPINIRKLISSIDTGVGSISSPYYQDASVIPDLKKILEKLGLKSTSDYPKDYGVDQSEINNAVENINALFSDKTKEKLNPDVNLNQIISVSNVVNDLNPCSTKVELTNEFLLATNLFSIDFYPYTEKFDNGLDNWIIYGDSADNSNGLTIKSNDNVHLGIMSRLMLPMSFNKKYTLQLNLYVNEAGDEPSVIVGAYMPGTDLITVPELTYTSDLGLNYNSLSFTFTNVFDVYLNRYPGIGFKNVSNVTIQSLVITEL